MVLLCAVLSIKRPGVALGLVLCHYALKQSTQSLSPALVGQGAMMSYLIFSVAILAIIGTVVRGELAGTPYPRQGWLFGVLLVWAFTSMTWSIYPQAFDLGWGFAPYMIGYVALAPLVIRHLPDWRDAIWTSVVIGSLSLGALLAGGAWNVESRAVTLQTETGATFGSNPLALGEMGGYLAIALMLVNIPMRKWYWHPVRWGLLLMGLAVAFRSASRGQVIAAVMCMLVFLPISRRLRNAGSFISVVVVASILLGGAYTMYQSASEVDAKRWDTNLMTQDVGATRLGTTMQVLDAWMGADAIHKILGLGSGSSYEVLGIYPHFVPGEILGELGPVGFIIYLMVLGLTVRSCYRLGRACIEYPDARGYAAVLMGFCAYEFLLSLKQGSLLGNSPFMMLWIVAGRLAEVVAKQQSQANALALLPMGVGAETA